MYASVIFIEQDHATIFKLKPSGVETDKLKAHGPKHHAESQGRNHSKNEGDAHHFYHEVAQHMTTVESDRWLIVGPGLAKKHFQSHVESHHKPMAKRIVGVETLDKSSDNEVVKFAHTFFKKWDQFNNP